MKKYSLTTLVSYLLLSIPFIYSCQKTYNGEIPEEKTQTGHIISTWINNQISVASRKKEDWLRMLRSSLKITDTHSEETSIAERVLIIPLTDSFKSHFNRDRSRRSALILTTDSKTGEVIRANVLLYKTGKNELPPNFMKDFNRADVSHNDGEFTFLDTFDRYLFTTIYKDNIAQTSRMAPRKEVTGEVSTQAECYEWVLVTTYYAFDGHVDYTTETSLGIYCNGSDCSPGDPMCVNNGDSQNPEGGAGGGSAGGGEENCLYDPITAQSLLNAVTYSTGSDGGVVTGAETFQDDRIEKNLLIDRDRVTFHTHLNYSFTYALLFRGVVFKTGTNTAWKWKSLSFDRLQFVRGGTPPCMQETIMATVSTPNISQDKNNARWNAFVTATLTLPCLGGYKVATKTVTLERNYEAAILAH